MYTHYGGAESYIIAFSHALRYQTADVIYDVFCRILLRIHVS